MARTATNPDQLAVNAFTVPTQNAAAGVGAGNGNTVLAEPKSRKLFFRIAIGSGGTTTTVTFKAGSDFPAQKKGQGDLVLVALVSTVKYVVLDSMRFVNPDGKIYVDWSSTTSVTFEAIRDSDFHA